MPEYTIAFFSQLLLRQDAGSSRILRCPLIYRNFFLNVLPRIKTSPPRTGDPSPGGSVTYNAGPISSATPVPRMAMVHSFGTFSMVRFPW